MATKNSKNSGIALDFVNGLYSNTEIETKDPQPLFILHRDTIRTFLHEKRLSFGLEARVLGWFGIGITLIITLCTANFKDLFCGGDGTHPLLPGDTLQGIFFTFTLIIMAMFLFDGFRWLSAYEHLSVDYLTEDLGKRGSAIRPKCDKLLTAPLRENSLPIAQE